MQYRKSVVFRRAQLHFSVLTVALIACIAVVPAAAQVSMGPYLGAGIGPADTFPGLTARFGSGALQFAPGVEASFTDGFNRWQADANLLYRFEMTGSDLRPYFGAGVAVLDSPSENTGLGANALGGVSLRVGPVVPFIQSRLTIGQRTGLSMMGGILVSAPSRRRAASSSDDAR